MRKNQPIGVFDSGVGGLTVAKRLVGVLPNESIIYFGDTQHLPYGDKSVQVIQEYSKKVVDFLLAQNVKMIVIACHSASATAYEMLKEYVGDRAIVVDMVNPAVQFLKNNYCDKKIGLIGTKATIDSSIYFHKLLQLGSKVDLIELKTPLFVPIIEEGFAGHQIMDIALKESLSSSNLQDIDVLVLGCTHYSLIKEKLQKFYDDEVVIVDPAEVVANYVFSWLEEKQLLSIGESKHDFYISDYTDYFTRGAKMFFGEDIMVQVLSL